MYEWVYCWIDSIQTESVWMYSSSETTGDDDGFHFDKSKKKKLGLDAAVY